MACFCFLIFSDCTDGVGAFDTGGIGVICAVCTGGIGAIATDAAFDIVHLILSNTISIGGGGASFKIGEVFRLVHAATGNFLVKSGVILARFGHIGGLGGVKVDDLGHIRGRGALITAASVVRLKAVEVRWRCL